MRLTEARTGPDLLDVLARRAWHLEHGGAACPPDRIPTEATLCAWFEAEPRDLPAWTLEGPDGPEQWAPLALPGVDRLQFGIVRYGENGGGPSFVVGNLLGVHRAWCGTPAPRPVHPVLPLVMAWQRRPAHADRNARPDRPLPARLGMIRQGDSRAGRLFTPALHTDPAGQLVMPGFGADVSIHTPALPLHLYDLGIGDAVEQRGRGAPLALRLWVEAVLSVPLADRYNPRPVSMEVTLRGLLAVLYPNGAPSPARYWPRLVAAVEVLDSMAARIPWEDRETGKRGLRRVVSISDLPPYPRRGHKEDLCNALRLIVDLPPGATDGPIITPTLPLWGVKSAAAYRALIGLHFRWWEPGKTRRPVGRGARRVWYQSADPRDYGDPLTDAEAVALCFPTSTRKQRRNLTPLSWQVLTTLTDAGELRNVQGVMMPPKIPPKLLGDGRKK